jgi:ribonuclease D
MPDLPEEIVAQSQDVGRVCADLAECRKFGLDTEFVGENTYHPNLCLIQLATEKRLYLIDPLTVGPLDAFWSLVIDPANLVVVHAGREEIRLCRLWTGRTPGHFYDLQIAAGLCGMAYPLGHAALVSQLLGITVPKGETLTEWRDRPLTPKQIRYAFDDVRYLLPCWEQLSKELESRGRMGWAEEEFKRLANASAPEEPSGDKWRKLRGLGSLSRRELAIVRELSRWRDEYAAQSNRPIRTILRDDLLIEIARRNPRREGDLRVIRGIPRRHVKDIVAAVDRANSIPLEQCPPVLEREQDPPQAGFLTNAVLAVLGNICARLRLASNLVATTQDVKALVRSYLQGVRLAPEVSLAQGWRRDHILPELRAFLEGRLSLKVADLNSEAPFAEMAAVEENANETISKAT